MNTYRLIAALLVVASVGVARADSQGPWFTGSVKTGDTLYAGTVNDSGDLLGQYCFLKNGLCVWLLSMKTGCEQGHQYPVLANSDAGAVSLEVYCSDKLRDGSSSYVFTNFNAVENVIVKGSRVGFAMPLRGDHFRVIRFSLHGSSDAVSNLHSTFSRKLQQQKNATPPAPTGTRDKML